MPPLRRAAGDGYDWPSFDALWFYGSGIGGILSGAFTPLAASDRASATLAVTVVVADLLGVALALAFGASHIGANPRVRF